MAEETGTNAPGRLRYGQRKASFSDTLNKLKTNSFTRRRTAPDSFISSLGSSSSSSYIKVEPQQEQPQPQPRRNTPSRIPRNSSILNSLNTLVPRRATSYENNESDTQKSKPVKPPRKITHRFSKIPPFFNSILSQQAAIKPVISKSKSHTQITQRALMQPMSNPPLPRRSTMGNVTLRSPTQIPGFMRPTSSSEARRKSGSSITRSPALTQTATPNKYRARQNGQVPPTKNFSMPSASMLRKEMVHEETTPVASPNYSFKKIEQHSGQESGHSEQQSEQKSEQQSEQHSGQQSGQSSGQSERPKLTMDSNLTFEELLRTVTPVEELGKVSGEPAAVEESEEAETAPEPIFVPNPQQITTAQPSAYWAGRMTVLSDRFRNEALESSSSSANDSDMHDDSRRLRRVFIHLRGLCANQKAIDSLEAFQQMWAMREYGREGGGNEMAREVSSSNTSGKKVKEKKGVFEKLTGRKK